MDISQSTDRMSTKLLNNSEEPKIQENAEIKKKKIKQKFAWINIIVLGGLHVLSIYGIWLILTFNVSWKTLLLNLIYHIIAEIGVTGGSHRLWAHKCYKAKLPLRIWLALTQTMAFQKDIYQWVREHRVHHKHVDTDADPHNSTRGFLFCHIGWVFLKKHPEVIEKGKKIDVSDVFADPVVKFQKKYYWLIMLVVTFFLPTYLPVYFWKEKVSCSFFTCVVRIVFTVQATGCVNSFAHMYGYKPYDKGITPVENKLVSMIACGEGWHNYHHTFPWDYKAAELGNYSFNFTTAFIDCMAFIGQAYDLKSVSKEMVQKKAFKTGDGSWEIMTNYM